MKKNASIRFILRNQGEKFLFSPLLIALILAVLLFIIIPPFEKYQLELKETFQVEKPGGISFYDDIDSDGFSEYIIAFKNSVNELAVKIMTHDNRLLDQWNFRGEPPPLKFTMPVYCGDFDADGFSEIYAINLVNDSIFLNIISPKKSAGINRKNIFIDKIADYHPINDFSVNFEHLADFYPGGNKELIFGIYAGFSLQPRQVYVYDIHNNNLNKSPSAGVLLNNLSILDLDGDGLLEILGSNCGPGNIKPWNPIPYRDSSSYLMVLNNKLKFAFEPIEFPAYKSVVSAIPIVFQGDTNILTVFINFGVQAIPNSLNLFDITGKQLVEKQISSDLSDIKIVFGDKQIGKFSPVFLSDKLGDIYKIDEQLNLVYETTIADHDKFISMDVDEDGEDQLVSFSGNTHKLIVTRQGFKYPTTASILPSENPMFRLSLKHYGPGKTDIFLQKGAQCYLITYKINPWFQFRIVLYLGILFVLWFFIFLLKKLYKYQIIKQQRLQQEITSLQFNSINKQISPHFIFNALNSISSSIYKEEKDDAYSFITKFSMLFRELLQNSDTISRTLENELAFVKNYIDLEKFRFKNTFDYRVELSPEVNLSMEVPKMIIQIFAENAVLHGLRPIESGGLLIISIDKKDNEIIIRIHDNGIGREKARENGSTGSGNGLGIIRQILELYRKLKGIKIECRISDLKNADESPSGTLVEIKIPVND